MTTAHAHDFALLRVRMIQELLGHEDLNTTMIYTHVTNKVDLGVRSPADRL